ncbi:flagellar export chaperone FliS [Salibacterium salarium]|uniref:Flagellar secretion chaperone FliS n=1 Tax=Salibacterium salarium TaxID=284579 RepID=A0A3R9PJB7_9BACI|nr:flagellar export chaperone FliS [Salibacterium salarium]RSL32014.1 flagellar export chaperone FliS [Salibacterium salarium]
MTFLTEEIVQKKTPQQLTALLFEACIGNLEEAVQHIERKQYIKANEKFQRSIDIVERLGAGLNYEAGIIADELDALYNYINNELITANMEKDKQKTLDVLTLIQTLAASWNEALQSQTDKQSQIEKSRTNAYEQHIQYDR